MNTTVSNEMLTIGVKRKLGIRMEAVFDRILAKSQEELIYSNDDLLELGKIIEEETGMVTMVFIVDNPIANAAMAFPNFDSHNGVGYQGKATKPLTLDDPYFKNLNSMFTIDLDAGRITGTIAKRFTNNLYITTQLFGKDLNLTARELTGICCHEVGHAFDVIATMGDYVWLNYYLQEGVEVVLGRKPNKYKVEVLSIDELAKSLKNPTEARRLMNEPTEENVRRAILVGQRHRPRHFLRSTEVDLSKKRHEQMADLFVARQGYGKDMITASAKIDKAWRVRATWSSKTFWIAETVKIISAVVGVAGIPLFGPAALMFWVVSLALGGQESGDTYDTPIERAAKVRRDLINQLKAVGDDPVTRSRLLEDIQVLDQVIKDYHNHVTVWTTFTRLFNGEARRQYHFQQHEEQLERLFSNDLFLASEKLTSLK